MSYPFVIKQKEYTITPTLKEDIAAGQLVTGYDPYNDIVTNRLNYKYGEEDKYYTANLLSNSIIKDWGEIKFADNTPVEGEADFIAMSDIQSCALVFEEDQAFENTMPISWYYGKDLKTIAATSRPYTGYLKYGDTYYLSINKDSIDNTVYSARFDAFGHEVSYDDDYQFQTVIVNFTPNKRGSGSVSVVDPNQMAITESVDNTLICPRSLSKTSRSTMKTRLPGVRA